jgi:hypothetical protein
VAPSCDSFAPAANDDMAPYETEDCETNIGDSPDSLNAMELDTEHIKPTDLPIEVTITAPGPRILGYYSDIYVGRFGYKIVRLHNPLLRNTRLIFTLIRSL